MDTFINQSFPWLHTTHHNICYAMYYFYLCVNSVKSNFKLDYWKFSPLSVIQFKSIVIVRNNTSTACIALKYL